MTRPDPILVAECMAENRPRLLGIAEAVSATLTVIDAPAYQPWPIPKDLSNPRKVQKP